MPLSVIVESAMDRTLRYSLAVVLAGGLAAISFAGRSPEAALLIVDPTSAESMYVANYYKNARNIPDSNVIYIRPGATNYTQFVDLNQRMVFGHLANARTTDSTDIIVTLPGSPFFVDAPGLITDGCFPVNRFSISGAYSLMFNSAEIQGATLRSTESNRFFGSDTSAQAFDSSLSWFRGVPSNDPNSRRYFIGSMLGYTGTRGNTLAEILAMVDRSVAADGTRPAGTFYYCRTGDSLRSGPRDRGFQAAVDAIRSLGGQAELQDANLPIGRNDVLGIMTGLADPLVEREPLTILPGAFTDHLTSYAATFDVDGQMKVSSWIRKGASGSWGTVEEPCNYAGKFPNPRLHVWYFQGLTLAEATFRSVSFAPFQGLLYGDPLTRPFAFIPRVVVQNPPSGPQRGVINLNVEATTDRPNGGITSVELYINGVYHSVTSPTGSFAIDTTGLPDGFHDLRVVAYDNSVSRIMGRWSGALEVANESRSTNLSVTRTSGNLTDEYPVTVSASGATEVRALVNGRVVGAASGANANFDLAGLDLGAGPAFVQGEALFADGQLVRSDKRRIDVAFTDGTPSRVAPVAYSYTKRILRTSPAVIELPATFDERGANLTYTIVQAPSQAAIPAGQSGPYRLIVPNANATGTDTVVFRVSSPYGDSANATVTIVYGDPLTIEPIGVTVVRGGSPTGRLDALFFSDDRRLVVQQRAAASPATPNVRIELTGSTIWQIPSRLSFAVESSTTGSPASGVERTIELYNFDFEIWELVDRRTLTSGDSVFSIDVTSDVGRFVEPSTRRLRARMSWFDRGTSNPGWTARLDQVAWTAVR